MDFEKDYFYGKSNYLNYELTESLKSYKGEIDFIKRNKIRGRVIDIGCAFGFFLEKVEKLFTEVYGCDISNYAIKKAKRRVKTGQFKVLNITNGLDYPDNYFDLVTCFDVLEHTPSFEKSLLKIVKKTKKGGYLMISTPIMNFLRKYLVFERDKTHISIMLEKEINRLIKKLGLKIIKKSYILPFFPISVIYYLKKT